MRDLLAAQSPVLTSLISTATDRALSQAAKTTNYTHEELIHSRGDAAPGLSIVRKGAVKVGNVGVDGSYLTTSVLGTGQCFGEFTLFADLPRTHEATAVGTTTVDQIPARRFLRLFETEAELSRALLTISLRRTHGLLEFVDDMRRLPLPVRVAKFLLFNTSRPDLNVLQEDIAFTFGVSRVSMSKVLKRLEREGLIQRGYRQITILDRSALENWVESNLILSPLQ